MVYCERDLSEDEEARFWRGLDFWTVLTGWFIFCHNLTVTIYLTLQFLNINCHNLLHIFICIPRSPDLLFFAPHFGCFWYPGQHGFLKFPNSVPQIPIEFLILKFCPHYKFRRWLWFKIFLCVWGVGLNQFYMLVIILRKYDY